MSQLRLIAFLVLAFGASVGSGFAQDRVYFVTYDHLLEEPKDLEIAVASTTGFPKAGQSRYVAPWLEIEYGVTGWWTAELYLEGVTTRHDGSGFSGWRAENRFRPLQGERRINPVFYIEYESVNAASRIQKEIVGSGPLSFDPIATLREEHAHELEGKLILSSKLAAWNLSENFIVEKNLSEDEGLEFGYSVGTSRSLGDPTNRTVCRLCRESFVAGVEAYGGLGSTKDAALGQTRHFIAPVLAWHVTMRSTVKVSTAFGVTVNSDHLLRVSWAYER